MQSVVSSLSDSLHLYPPTNGGINMKKLSISPSQSPAIRRSIAELPLEFFARKPSVVSQSSMEGYVRVCVAATPSCVSGLATCALSKEGITKTRGGACLRGPWGIGKLQSYAQAFRQL